jgi:rhamnose transport system permease protein
VSEVLVDEAKGPTGAAGILLSRGALMIYALVAVLLYCMIFVPRFASVRTTGFLLLDVIPILMIATPMTLIIISGEIDLSVASTAGLTSAVMGVLWAGGTPMPVVLVVCLLVGLAAGMLNGVLVSVVGLPSLAVTIGTLALFRGLALVVIGDRAVANFPRGLTRFATSKIGDTGIPTVMVGVVALIVVFGVVLHLTPFGRALFALGYSPEAARASSGRCATPAPAATTRAVSSSRSSRACCSGACRSSAAGDRFRAWSPVSS